MNVDGRRMAAELYRELKNEITHLDTKPHFTAFTCAPNFETKKFLEIKKRNAERVGIGINVIEFPEDAAVADMKQSILHSLMQTDGVVIQLPFPGHIPIVELLNEVPSSYDMDGIHYDGTSDMILPPVVGAIQGIAKRHEILFATQKVVIVGHGRLVGKPAALWAQKQGAQVSVLTRESKDIEETIQDADILILGAGQPELVTPDMVKDGVVIFDAGTSESAGVLRGDAHPDCAEKASLLTPVPGGIGPVTIAVLLKNLVKLTKGQS